MPSTTTKRTTSSSTQNLGSPVYRSITVPGQKHLNNKPRQDEKMDGQLDHDCDDGCQFSSPISDKFYDLFTSNENVSSLLALDPTMNPGDAWHKLYGHHAGKPSGKHSVDHAGKHAPSLQELKRAADCGHWGPTQPSKLFLTMYRDALNSLEENPAHAVVSPSLMGSCGVLPLTIISTIPDIVRHMSNCIVRAEREVFLATNYWANSTASKFITDAMRELSRRAGERGTKIVMKIMYDRGSPKQLVEPHYLVSPKDYTGPKVNIPGPEEIPNIDLQVMNYHHPLLGTFHAKYMVVDRKIAILQSNNIQDNDNLEMMVHMEGPIVDSLYDMALISWHKRLEPPLPSHNSPAAQGGISSFTESHVAVFGPSGSIRGHMAVVDPAKMRPREPYAYDQKGVAQPGRVECEDPTRAADVLTGPTTTEDTVPGPQPGSISDRPPPPSNETTQQGSNAPNHGPDADTQAFLAEGQQAGQQAPMPAAVASALPEHTTDDPHWDVDIAHEVLRVQAAVSAKPGSETTLQAISRHLNHTINMGYPPTAPEDGCAPEDEMTPYIPHTVHEPFPIAMVNRAPHGPPNHKSVSMPQNAVWLSALRNAEKTVFIQSPTLNAEPLLPAIREACERGVDVYCYICLGYNDAGELLPMQGGHNDMVAHRLYAALSEPAKQRLHYFWYVAKDQAVPLVQEKKKRSCHIKLMIVDGRVGIQGNGNQDTQSWFHSQEINVMLESEAVCRAWVDALRRNQNTHRYGALDKAAGVWTDARGEQAEGAIGIDPGRFAWAKGVVGAIKRVQGDGGF